MDTTQSQGILQILFATKSRIFSSKIEVKGIVKRAKFLF